MSLCTCLRVAITLMVGRGGKPGWMYGLVVVLYLLALLAGEVSR
jgi:hypothetical protein